MRDNRNSMAWIVWGVGVFAYSVTVMQRTALGVAGLEAADHFRTTPGVVSTLVVVQLFSYAFAQVPIGVLLDRYGSRIMLTAGSLVVAASQVLLGVADDLPLAYVARILLGIGDACMFSSVLRLLPRWFPPARVPVLQQVTGVFAAMGQIASVVVVLPLIDGLGWRPGLLIAASLSVVGAAAAAAWVRNAPYSEEVSVVDEPFSKIPRAVANVTRHPATQLGFWVHFTSGFSTNAFLFMWGMPYLLVGQGMTQLEASAYFTLLSVAMAGSGPILGALTARHPLRRSNLALIMIGALIAAWALVLAWPGRAPTIALVALVLLVAVNGPTTGIGFDFTRTNLPHTRLGAANGVVNMGGFVGGTTLVLLMGFFLDQIAGGEAYTPDQLRLAWLLQIPFFVVGIVGLLLSRRSLRRRMAAQGVVVPSWREVVERIRRKRAAGGA